MKRLGLFGSAVMMLGMSLSMVMAQGELAATLEVLSSGVEVQRVNTSNGIAVEVEAIVGVGDIIRTDETGEARITFFADGTDVTIMPESEYRINAFSEDGGDDFTIVVEVLVGQTFQRLNRVLGANSTYDVETPGMTLAAQGTEFMIRVEDDERSAMLVQEGMVDAEASGSQADVEVGFGVRSETGAPLSDVVRATTFEELDSGLDGCTAILTTLDDVSLNVRVAPNRDAERIGTIAADDIDIVVGTTATGDWYRIDFEDSFGWILSSTATIDNGCAGLRIFEDDWAEDGFEAPVAEPEATAEAGA